MTEAQANQLKFGNRIYVACFLPGISPQVITTNFAGVSRNLQGEIYGYEIADGTLWRAARLHHTEAEARSDVSNMIRERIARLQTLLQEWESS